MTTKTPVKKPTQAAVKAAERAALRKLAGELRPAKTHEELKKIWGSKKRHSVGEWVVYAENLALLNEKGGALPPYREQETPPMKKNKKPANHKDHEKLAARLLADDWLKKAAVATLALEGADAHKWLAAVEEDVSAHIAGEAKHYDVSVLVGMVFKLEGGEPTAMPKFTDFEVEQYSGLTTWLWYQTHPTWPRDDFGHTSDVCRSLAVKVLDFLATLPEAKPVKSVKAKTAKRS